MHNRGEHDPTIRQGSHTEMVMVPLTFESCLVLGVVQELIGHGGVVVADATTHGDAYLLTIAVLARLGRRCGG